MTYEITETRTKLKIIIGHDEVQYLRRMKKDLELCDDHFATTMQECDFLEPLVCNSELDWIDPTETGDLTEAPMLGIRDEEGKVIERWAYMDYQVRSFLSDLADNGYAVFTG
jgi:hypothetical protein